MDRIEEIKKLKEEIRTLTSLKNEYKNEEQGIKLTMNSIYGAIGNNYFACFNPDVAEAVTLQGQDLIKYSSMLITRYFHEFWHLDTDLHQKLGISTPKKVIRPLVVYGDTDSVFSSSIIIIQNNLGEEFKVNIEEFFMDLSKIENVFLDHKGNHIIEPKGIRTLNFIDGDLFFSPVKKIIRHKVTKAKWRIVSQSGKEVIVTNDHSITIFRNGQKIHVKPSEINPETDEILTVNVDI
jgi:hypothetical protein